MNDSSVVKRILIADDEPLFLQTTGQLLRKEGYDCVCVPHAQAALQRLQKEPFDLILSDLNMPGNLKLELLREGRSRYAHIPLIVVTGVPSLPTAIESVRLGIADYLLKPVKFEVLLGSIKKALTASGASANQDRFADHLDTDELTHKYSDLLGESVPMREVLEIIERVSQSDANVLISGESGTGKEVVARAIHNHSRRHPHGFQIVDCTAIPESLFESVLFGHARGSFTGAVKDQGGLLSRADGGTVFLDELGELPLHSQAKLLRAVQEQSFVPVGKTDPIQIDTRYICATNRELQEEVNAGRFRQDLYYRLGVIHIELPPLRDRADDVLLLSRHFLKTLQTGTPRVTDLSEEVIERFRTYNWPGNIRELRNVIERSIALAGSHTLQLDDLPAPMRDASRDRSRKQPELGEISRVEALDNADREYLHALLLKHNGNVSRAAHQAGLSRQGMHKLLNKHEISPQDFRS